MTGVNICFSNSNKIKLMAVLGSISEMSQNSMHYHQYCKTKLMVLLLFQYYVVGVV